MGKIKRRLTQEELIQKLNEQRCKGPFYRIPALNYQGAVKDSSEDVLLEEEIARWLIEKIDKEGMDAVDKMLLEHSTMKLEKDNFPEGDGPIHSRPILINDTNRNEENIAKCLFNEDREKETIKILDYQVPVNRVLHSGNGKVDLIMEDQGKIILAELKDNKSEETLLRAITEARTYFLKVSKSKEKATGESGKQTAFDRFTKCYGESFRCGVIFFEGTRPFDSWKDQNLGYLHSLAGRWNVRFYKASLQSEQDSDTPIRERRYNICIA